MIERITDAVRSEIPEEKIKTLLSEKSCAELKNFIGSSASLLLHQLHSSASRILVIAPEMEKASALASDLQELDKESDSFLLFPATNRKPYDTQMVVDLSVM